MFMQSEIHTATINPVFAGHAAQHLQDATGGIQRVLDNLLEIAKGKDPEANTYDRIRATKVLYDRGFGKVAKIRHCAPSPEPSQSPQSAKSQNQTNHSSDRPVAKLEEKLDDALGPPQAPVRLHNPNKLPHDPNRVPDLVHEAQYYILEITNYGAELASILAYIHEPDPEDTSVKPCHRITAGQMILDRVLGAVADLQTPPDHNQDPAFDADWANKHPAEIDPNLSLEKIIEADDYARNVIEGMRKERERFEQEYGDREDTGPCGDCFGDDDLCEYHVMAYELSKSEEEILDTVRGMRNIELFRDRLYFDENGIYRIHPPDHIDDS